MVTQADLEYAMLIAKIEASRSFSTWIGIRRWKMAEFSIGDCGLGFGDLD